MKDRAELTRRLKALAAADDGPAALALYAEVWRAAWFDIGDLAGGAAAAALALDAPGAAPSTAARARVLYADHLLAFRAGDQSRTRSRAEECLRVARAAADLRGECDGFTGLARVALRAGDYAEVVDLARAARAKAEAAGDRAAGAGPLHLEAAGCRLDGQLEVARQLYTQSLELARELDNAGTIANELHNLGWVELHLGNIDAAEERFRDFERVAHAAHHAPWVTLDRAAIAVERGDSEAAQALLAAGERALTETGLTLDPDDRAELEWLRRHIHERLGGSSRMPTSP